MSFIRSLVTTLGHLSFYNITPSPSPFTILMEAFCLIDIFDVACFRAPFGKATSLLPKQPFQLHKHHHLTRIINVKYHSGHHFDSFLSFVSLQALVQERLGVSEPSQPVTQPSEKGTIYQKRVE
jgi:hypothetical protein